MDGMPLREIRTAVRGATYRGDTTGIIQLLEGGGWPDELLQLVGDALLVGMTSTSQKGRELARGCVARLEARGWDGDAELAEALSARLGDGARPMLRPIPVDLEELASVLEGDPANGGGRIDLKNGEVWPEMAYQDGYLEDKDDHEDEDDDTRWLYVDPVGSRPGYRDMERFIDTLDDDHLAELLTVAIGGPGAFRRFKQVLASRPEVADRWYAFSDDRTRGRARAWLADQGYTTSHGRPASER